MLESDKFYAIIDYLEAHPNALEQGCTHAERRETHISVVLLTASFAFKFKKPVSLGFIEQANLAARLENCRQEIALNSRLSDGVYLGIRGIHHSREKFSISPILENALEYCVQMNRLNEADSLLGRLKKDTINLIDCDRIALKLARFHAKLRADRSDSNVYQFEKNLSDNLKALRQSGRSDETMLAGIEDLFQAKRPSLERRVKQGRIIDGHGDLRLEHVFLHNDQSNIIDCVEFNASIRSVDPLEDIAFLSLGFRMEDREDLATSFLNAYYSYSFDPHPELITLFEIYRATVRMKIDLIQLSESIDPNRSSYLNRRYEKYGELIRAFLKKQEIAKLRSISMTLVLGPPLSGKSTRARELSHIESAVVLATDVARKILLKTDIFENVSTKFSEKYYSPRLKSRVYRYVRATAKRYLQQGYSLILDGTFSRKIERKRFADLADALGVKMRVELLDIDETTAAQRIETRKHSDSISDLKDLATWKKVRSEFEPL